MFTGELLNNHIPTVSPSDSVASALNVIADYKISHVPIVSDNKYVGLVSETDLLDAEDPLMKVSLLEKHFIQASLKEKVHFLQAVHISNLFNTNVVPIVNNDHELLGTITSKELLNATGIFSGAQEQGALLILQVEKNQFSISEISRIVESNDATILHLNTNIDPITGLLIVTLQLNKKELSAIVATFERYEYNVTYYFGDEKFENDIQSNYENLMNYLEI